jgi:hypothetical protein
VKPLADIREIASCHTLDSALSKDGEPEINLFEAC